MNSSDPPAPAPAGAPTRRRADHAESIQASRRHWDADAVAYLHAHGQALGDADLLWCPEGIRESSARLLGPVAGRRFLEVGCGAGQGGRWLAAQGAQVVGIDLSSAMLAQGRLIDERSGVRLLTVQSEATQLPFRDDAFDGCFSAFGALPFLPDVQPAFAEMVRVVRPGGRVVCSVRHPVRWMLPDDPGPSGLVITHSYFDRRGYVEEDSGGRASYVEHHRTIGDWVQAWVDAGLVLDRLVEPEWVDETPSWGAWGPERGAMVPGSLILCGHSADAAPRPLDPPNPVG